GNGPLRKRPSVSRTSHVLCACPSARRTSGGGPVARIACGGRRDCARAVCRTSPPTVLCDRAVLLLGGVRKRRSCCALFPARGQLAQRSRARSETIRRN